MADVADLNPAFLPLLNAYTGALDKAGIGYRLDSGYRTPEQQSEIYARSNQGRSFAAAPPWRSFHNYGLAADVIPNNPADYARMHDLARQAGLYDAQGGLGFTSYDPPHVEMPGSLSNLISQYHLAGWRPQGMSAPATGAIAYSGPSAQPSQPGTQTPGTSLFRVPENAPMGMRNNNPLNIKYAPSVSYDGLAGPSANTDQGDPQNVFKTPEAGWAAGYSLLNKKYGSGMTTPNQIIAGKGGWTPGNTQAAANVAKAAGIGPDDDIGFNDPLKAQKFMRALVTQEQGAAASAYPDAMIAGAAGQAPGPIDPSIIARGGTSPPIPTAPGTTINSTPAVAGIGGQLGQLSKDPNVKKMLGLPDDDGQDQQAQTRPSPMIQGPGARNVSFLLGGPGGIGQGQVSPAYAQRMAALNQPMTWGAAPPGQMAGTGYGAQAQPSVYGTSLMSNLGRSLDPMWMNSWGT